MERTTFILEAGCIEAVRDLTRKEGRQLSRVVNDLLLKGIRGSRQRTPGFFQGPAAGQSGDRQVFESLWISDGRRYRYQQFQNIRVINP